MKEKIKEFLNNDGKYFLVSCILLVVVILTITVKHIDNSNYTLNLPTNNTFGMISYIMTIVLSLLGFIIFKNIDKKEIKLEKIYLMIVIPLGILYCLANPLGRIADEDNHIIKAMDITQGHFFSDHGDFNIKLWDLVSWSTSSYEDAINRINIEETDETHELYYSTMALYAPICHMPQALGIMVAKVLGGNLVVQCYAARIGNFIISIFLIYQAIKLIPFKKYIVMFISLLPLTMCELASMSSDALTIAISIFFICYILYLKYDENKKQIMTKDIAVLMGSSIVIALCKIVYIPLVLLLFILPKEKFGTLKRKNIITIVIAAVSILINLIWLKYSSVFLVNFKADSMEQVQYVLTHPISYILIVFRTLSENSSYYILQLFGEGLAVLQTSGLIIFSYIVLAVILFVVNEEKNKIKIDKITKYVFGIIFLIILALICTSLYVQWTKEIGSPVIEGIQIRYILPILPLLIIMLDNNQIVFNGKLSKRYLMQFLLFFNLVAITNIMFIYF